MLALSKRDCHFFNSDVSETLTAYEQLQVLCVAFFVVFAYFAMFHEGRKEIKRSSVAQFVSIEFSILVVGAFLGTTRKKAIS